MPEDFRHDLFLSHSSKDKAAVRAPAERLCRDEWLDLSFALGAAEFGFAPLAAGLPANAFDSNRAPLEVGTLRVRNPLTRSFTSLEQSVTARAGVVKHVAFRVEEVEPDREYTATMTAKERVL